MEDWEKILTKHKEDRLQAEFEHNKSKSLLDSTMKRAFYDPEASMEKMDLYAKKKNSREALYEKLKDTKQVFGRRPGSILSKDGFKSGAETKRRDADIARHNLPMILRDADTKREVLQNARKAERDALDRYGPKNGAGGGPTEGPAATAGKSPTSGATGGGQRPSSGPTSGPAAGPSPTSGPSPYPKEAIKTANEADKSASTTSRPKVPVSEADKQNADARRQMQEKLAREQHPAHSRSEHQPQRQSVPMAPEAIQGRKTAAEARERAMRENNPAYTRTEAQPEQSPSKGSFSDRIKPKAPAPQRMGSFSDKLADMKKNPQLERDNGRSERTPGDEIER